jgi:hypothetical protein
MTNTATANALGTTNQEIFAVIRKGVSMGTTTEFTDESGEFYNPHDVLGWLEDYISKVESKRPDLKEIFVNIRGYANDDSLDGYNALDLIGQCIPDLEPTIVTKEYGAQSVEQHIAMCHAAGIVSVLENPNAISDEEDAEDSEPSKEYLRQRAADENTAGRE